MKSDPYRIDAYVLDTLMADLVAHDRRPSAFLVYLAILAASAHSSAQLSYAELAERTGISRRTAQTAVAALKRRRLIEVDQRGATDTPRYRPLFPWRRVPPSD